ncbi:M23 family metallopeptidase [Ramlibacter sp. USB13]|uniref:M23 family metallopeptidase n=1 Tax=Ramlibacter cellulosilyticus TaxID=2764187 RepID=A0A923MMF2_9BURK|nr:M23 family metallopeptidase [Ramlibacter cellulosilyticus]MBC5782312.1 M23 family metallopeptidase [Ramlibacter cellulosilyticus]
MAFSRVPWLLLLVVVLLHSTTGEPWRREAPPAPAQPSAVAEPVAPTPEELLAQRRLAVPVQGVLRTRLKDSFHGRRGKGRRHEAIDIMAPWGTPVVAADDGRIEKISRNAGGGLALYQADDSGRFVYYYAHLAGYADGLREGQQVRRGDVIAYVGATGNASPTAPHLHFAVMLHTPRLRWRDAQMVNPYPALAHEADAVAVR